MPTIMFLAVVIFQEKYIRSHCGTHFVIKHWRIFYETSDSRCRRRKTDQFQDILVTREDFPFSNHEVDLAEHIHERRYESCSPGLLYVKLKFSEASIFPASFWT